jgi:hypothetical protein
MMPHHAEPVATGVVSGENKGCKEKRDKIQREDSDCDGSHLAIEYFDRDSLACPEQIGEN